MARMSRAQVLLLAAVSVLLVAGCAGGSGISDNDSAAYLSEVRNAVPGAASYTDDQLLNMAENVCSVGSTSQGVEMLDNYSEIAAEDRERVAYLALTEACPEESGSG
jgi:hypothetical protein